MSFYTITSTAWSSDTDGTGIHLKWNYPIFIGHDLEYRIYLQRSTSNDPSVNSNWHLKPYYNSLNVVSPVPTPETGWDTISTWFIPNGTTKPTRFVDPFQTRPTTNYYYRLVVFVSTEDDTDYKEYDWAPVAVIASVPGTPLLAAKFFVEAPGASFNWAIPQSSCTDSLGNVYVCGIANPYGGVNPGSWAAKLDRNGNHLWSKYWSGDCIANAIAILSDGSVVVTGAYLSIDFGGGHSYPKDHEAKNVYIVKISQASGDYIWSTAFGSLTGHNEGSAIAVDANNNIVVAGLMAPGNMTVNHSDFAGATGSVVLTGIKTLNMWMAKFTSNGSVSWAKMFPTNARGIDPAGAIYRTGIAIDASANIIVSSEFQGTVDFSQGSGTPLTAVGFADIFIAKFNTAGTYLASRAISGSVGGTGSGIRCKISPAGANAAGAIYVVAWFRGSVTVLSTTYTAVGGVQDGLLIRLDSSLTPTWAVQITSSALDFPSGLSISPSGTVVVAGRFGRTLTVGSLTASAVGVFDMFLASINSQGTPLSLVGYGTPGGLQPTIATDCSHDSAGTLYAVITNNGEITFAPGVVMSGGVGGRATGGIVKFSP